MSYDQVAIEPDLQQSIDLLSGPNAIFTKNQILTKQLPKTSSGTQNKGISSFEKA